MVLEISNCENCYKIKGQLTQFNLHIFDQTFQNIFDSIDNLTLNIEDVIGIDRYGVNAIAKLHNQSITLNKKLSIIGLGNKDLYDEFRSNDAA
jgi:ABC-type transporter Mla MlaB component